MILAAFPDREAMLHAVDRLRADGLQAESYSALPPSEANRSPIPLIMLIAGLVGAFGSFAMQVYATGWGYVLDNGGRPDVFWPSYVPFSFEAGVLFAMAAGFLAFLVANRLPALYDPVDESDTFRAAMRDGWFVAIRGDTARAPGLLQSLQAAHVEELPG